MKSSCPLVRMSGCQDSEGYHINVKCTKCGCTGIFFKENPEDVRFDDEFDKEKYSCPGGAYIESLAKSKSKEELAKIQIRKGSIVVISRGKEEEFEGTITKYNSNTDLQLTTSGGFPVKFEKVQIIEVITY